MAVETVQLKVSCLMCSFCTMSVETALKRYDGVKVAFIGMTLEDTPNIVTKAGVEGLHVFTFNQIAATERWRRDLLARLPDRRHVT